MPWVFTAVDREGRPVEVAYARTHRYLFRPAYWNIDRQADVVSVGRELPAGHLEVVFGESGPDRPPDVVPEFPDRATATIVTADLSVFLAGLRPTKFRPHDAVFISMAIAAEISRIRKDSPDKGRRMGSGALWRLSTPVPVDEEILARYREISGKLPASNPHGLSVTDLPCAATATIYGAPMYTTKPEAYVGAGLGATMALTSTGGVYLWGADGVNWDGTPLLTPNRVRLFPDEERFAAISADGYEAALTPDGRLYCWDFAVLGALRRGHRPPPRLRLEPVPFPAGAGIASFSAGRGYLLAASTDGVVYMVVVYDPSRGRSGPKQYAWSVEEVAGFPPDVRIVNVWAGRGHAAALDSDGRVHTWGFNAFGESGNGRAAGHAPAPVLATCFPEGDPVVGLCLGNGSTTAWTASGDVWVVGCAVLDDGRGKKAKPWLPRQVTGFPDGAQIVEVSAGGSHWLARAANGAVFAWGGNKSRQLGSDSPGGRLHPVQVRGFPDGLTVKQVSAGWRHSVALATDGSMCAWGGNEYGELGTGSGDEWWRQHPAKVRWSK
jgi:alpha-tubulin suppressor-like RCC1 family protein